MRSEPNNSTSAKRYWRSLDELADTPEFNEWLHREFPSGASELEADGHSRRNFLKLMSASFALAGVATLGAGFPEMPVAAPGGQSSVHRATADAGRASSSCHRSRAWCRSRKAVTCWRLRR